MASRGVNKVIILGNLGQDPEVRYMQNGDPVATLNLATSETWRDKQTGEQREKTEWHRVVMFGKLAEVASQYLRKGSQVYIEGALQTRKWQDQQGVDRYTTEIVVQGFNGVMQMIGGRSAGGQGAPMGDMGMNNAMPNSNAPQNSQGNWNQAPSAPQFSGANPNSAPSAEPPMDFDDDIPF